MPVRSESRFTTGSVAQRRTCERIGHSVVARVIDDLRVTMPTRSSTCTTTLVSSVAPGSAWAVAYSSPRSKGCRGRRRRVRPTRMSAGIALVRSDHCPLGISSWPAASATNIPVLVNQRLRTRRVGVARRSGRDLAKTARRKLTSNPLIHPALQTPHTLVTRSAIRLCVMVSAGPCPVHVTRHARSRATSQRAKTCSRVSATSSRKQNLQSPCGRGDPDRALIPRLPVLTRWPDAMGHTDHARSQDMTFGGAEGDRTPDLLSAIQALSQLSYSPDWRRQPRQSYPSEGSRRVCAFVGGPP